MLYNHYNVKCSKPFRRSHFGYSVAQPYFPVIREVTSYHRKWLRHRLLGIGLHAYGVTTRRNTSPAHTIDIVSDLSVSIDHFP